MDKKELQKAQNIIDALFYDDKALTQWQHTLLENVISIAQTKLRQPDVSGRSEQLPNSCECDNVETFNGWGNEKCFRCIDCGRVW